MFSVYCSISQMCALKQKNTSNHLCYIQVTSLDPATKKISLDNGWELFYDKCLIATGGQPNNLPIFSKASPQIKERVSVYRTVSRINVLIVGVGLSVLRYQITRHSMISSLELVLYLWLEEGSWAVSWLWV